MILALWGRVGCGKTGLLLDLVGALRERGRVVGGVVQPRLFQDGRLVGYALRDVLSGEQLPFARRGAGPGGSAWSVDSAGWGWAARRLSQACERADVVILDELGLFEADGAGHLPALRAALRTGPQPDWVLGVRDLALPSIERAVGGCSTRLAVAGLSGQGAAGVEAILAALSGAPAERGPPGG